jgi:ABC-type branched-subunit amino acid transport system ATPase component
MAEPLLAVSGLGKTFGGVRAVDDCSFTVPEGSITGLIGPNGSGKTTVFNLVTGYLRPDAGRVRFAGRDVTRYGTRRLYRLGLSRTFQQARVFPALTVRENLVVAGGYRWWQLFTPRVRPSDARRAGRLLDEFGLAPLADAPASVLSYGQRKLLEFAAVLMSSPRLVLLDEPTAGVNPAMVAAMERHIRKRHAAGVTFLVVEHDMGFVMRVCDPVVVLDAGRPIRTGAPREVQDDPRVLDAYLGA